jgi:hypothetical protein
MITAQINLTHQLNEICYNFTYNDSWSFININKGEKVESNFSEEPHFTTNTYTNSISTYYYIEEGLTPYSTRDAERNSIDVFTSISQNFALTNLPLFFGKADLVKIPSKIKYALTQIPKNILNQVHPDKQVAYELCLLFVSQLTSTYFEVKAETNPEGWKSLNSTYLSELIGVDSCCYKRVREVLEYKLENGAIIQCDYKKISGKRNYHYRIGSWYLDKSVHAFKLQTEIAKKSLYKHYLKAFARASENSICRNLFYLYIYIRLPTLLEIEQEASRLIKQGYINKKGKTLVRRNKHSNNYFKNVDQPSFVEDAIEIFKYLTNEKRVLIPIVGGDASGGRIVDSFTLMPSWIRNMVTIKGQRLVECDYQCLHPNVAMSIYGGSSKFLTHSQLAIHLNLDVLIVKKEHLSFFNKPIIQMMQSPLWKYYLEKEPIMLQNLVSDKLNNSIQPSNEKHKITSRKLFKMEVNIMTKVIEKLNAEGIYVMYVYDALYCLSAHKERVESVMNQIVLSQGVYTKVKM